MKYIVELAGIKDEQAPTTDQLEEMIRVGIEDAADPTLSVEALENCIVTVEPFV